MIKFVIGKIFKWANRDGNTLSKISNKNII